MTSPSPSSWASGRITMAESAGNDAYVNPAQIAEYVPLELVPVTRDEARKFIGQHHRHNLPPQMVRIAVGVASGGQLVGVATAHNPVARMLDDGKTLEVTRSCTNGTPNANSMLYGAITRAAKALGFHKLVTYTLAEESGSSLRASGWQRDAELGERPSWDTPARPRVQIDLFGNERRPPGPKVRWVKALVPARIDGTMGE